MLISMKGEVRVEDESYTVKGNSNLKSILKDMGAVEIVEAQGSIVFTGGFVFRNLSIYSSDFRIVSKGVVRKRESTGSVTRYEYCFKVWPAMVATGLLVLVVFGPLVLNAPNVSFFEGVTLIFVSWIWLFYVQLSSLSKKIQKRLRGI